MKTLHRFSLLPAVYADVRRPPILLSSAHHWLEQNPLLWLRPLMVTGVLVTSVYLGSRASFHRLSTFAPFAAGAALIFLRWPPLGLVALVAASLVLPFAIGTGTRTELNITVLLLAALLGLWIVDMLARRDLRLLRSRPILPLLVFALVAILSFGMGSRPLLAFAQVAPTMTQVGGLAIMLLSAGAFLLVGHQMRNDLRWLRWLTWVFLMLGVLYVAGRLEPRLGRFTGRLFQTGADGSLFWTWLVALAFSQAAFNRSLRLPFRAALFGLVLAVLYMGAFRERAWVSGWLPPLAAVLIALWFGSPRLGLVAATSGGALAALNAQDIVRLVLAGDNQYSLATRLDAWRIMGEIVTINPLLGLGPANYYWYTPLFSIQGYHLSFNSHNNYVDILAQTGALGLAAFLWFVWEVGWLGWRLRARVRAGFGRAYVYGALGGLAGMLVAAMFGDWVLPFVYNIGVQGFRASVLGWLFLGGLVALEHSAGGEQSGGRDGG